MKDSLTPTYAILGGMGALAGTALGHRLMQTAADRGASTDDSFPRLIQLSLAPVGLDAHGLVDSDALRQSLLAQLEMLAGLGVDYVLPACNTITILGLAHPQLSILDPIALTIAELVRTHKRSAAVLCSETSQARALFSAPLLAAGITVIELNEQQRLVLTEAIAQLMAGAEPVTQLNEVIEQLLVQGAETVVLGCSELSMISDQLPHTCDAMQCLVNAVFEESDACH